MKAKNIIRLLCESLLLAAVIIGMYIHNTKSGEKKNVIFKRYKKYYELTTVWLSQILSDKDSVKEYLDSSGFKKIAIYGMGSIAELLSKQFERYADVEIKYYIDRNGRELFYGLNGLEVVDFEGIAEMEEVDVIIVTAIADYDEIMSEIGKKVSNVKVVSLEEIVNNN